MEDGQVNVERQVWESGFWVHRCWGSHYYLWDGRAMVIESVRSAP